MKLFLAYLHPLIFFSLTAISPAIAKYAKTGCSDKCGNVRIPYPFGIGAGCSINQWYTVDCISSTPYLHALNHLKVLGVDLDNQTVTVSSSRITDCQKPVWDSSEIMGVDLGRSPFWFSKSHNKFVFVGCGNAAMMHSGSVVTGCSTACGNATLSGRNYCYGIGCCQTATPRYLKSYSINITRLGEEDGACGSAFLVDKTSYDEGGFSDSFIVTNTTSIPISLLWTLTDSDQVTCCRGRTPLKPVLDVFNGTLVDTWKCSYYYERSLEQNPYLIDGCTENAPPKYAKTGCRDKCGNVTIPYPFGIGADCSVNKWYIVDCKSSTPYLPALNHLEVLGVDLENQTVTVSTTRISDCQKPVWNSSEIMGVDLGMSPFLFSGSQNKFVFKGCGTAAMIDNGSVLVGCSTVCPQLLTHSHANNCFGIGCCQTVIPYNFKSYSINLTGLEEEDGACGSAALASYDQGRFSVKKTSFIPISILWTLADSDQVTCCYNNPKYFDKVDLFNGTAVDTWTCPMSLLYQRNPYLVDGCSFIYGEADPAEECRRCHDSGGYCSRDMIYDVANILFGQNIRCYHDKKRTSLGVILV